MTKYFYASYLKKELELPNEAIEDKIIDIDRWSALHEIIFKTDDEKFWRTSYYCGLTELQHEGPWEYENKVECEEVKLKTAKVEMWVPIEE